MVDQIWSLVNLRDRILQAKKRSNVLVLLPEKANVKVMSHLIYSQESPDNHWVRVAKILDPVRLPEYTSAYRVVLGSLSLEGGKLENFHRWCDKKNGFKGFL